jgi:hypothetical protein
MYKHERNENQGKTLDTFRKLGPIKISLWRIKAQDRKEWSAIPREAKAKLKGP